MISFLSIQALVDRVVHVLVPCRINQGVCNAKILWLSKRKYLERLSFMIQVAIAEDT